MMSDSINKSDNDPSGVIAYHDSIFGEGSWAEMEKGVRERHPAFFAVYDSMGDEEEEQERKWWQIWK